MTNLPRRRLLSMLPPAIALLVKSGAASAAHKPVGFMLMTVDTDLRGVLPVKSSKFFGPGPIMLPLQKPHYDFLYAMWPGGYSFGGLVAGMSIGWGLYNQGAFTVEPDEVVYLGCHRLFHRSSSTFGWEVTDDLDRSLSGLTEKDRARIAGLPVKKAIAVPQPGKPA